MNQQNLNIKTRLVDRGGKLISQVYLTPEILSHKLNRNVNVKAGWQDVTEFNPTLCNNKPKPADPEGEVGRWMCVDSQWIWVPFVG